MSGRTNAAARSAVALAMVVGLGGAARAQSQAGVYAVQGDEPGRGAFSGRVELRWRAGGYDLVREVEYGVFTSHGRPVSLVWRGRARDLSGGGVAVDVALDRTGWALTGPGLSRRGPADRAPVAVTGTFAPAGLALAGSYRGQAPFALQRERWVRQSAPGSTPIWRSAREVRPAHAPPPPAVKRALFSVFASFHQQPWVQPYVGRPEFQAAVHGAVFDRTDFALHRQRPALLRVIQRVVDPLHLAEAEVKADAFGKPLHRKAAEAQAEIGLFRDPTGALGSLDPAGRYVPDGDGALWTGVYAYAQALRWQATGDPTARDEVERTVRALRDQIEITGRPDTFARTVETTAGGSPRPGWVAGTGSYAGVAWLPGGNNDMFKGLLLGGLAAHEALPAGHPLRAAYGRSLQTLARSSPVVTQSRWLKINALMANGVTSLLLGSNADRQAYRAAARNPWQLLYNAAVEGGLYFQGIADWSGTHLGVTTQILEIRLAEHHGDALVAEANRLGLRRAGRRFAPIRRTLFLLAAAGMAQPPFGQPFDGSDGVWRLREIPIPRPSLTEGHFNRPGFCASPYPALPWKLLWNQSSAWATGLVAPPFFESFLTNYLFKCGPYPTITGFGGWPGRFNSIDFLFGYWLARSTGVIGPSE